MVRLPKNDSINEAVVMIDDLPPRVIQERAARALRQSAYPPLTTLCCEFHDGVLTVRGRVPSFHLKQITQVLLRDVEGVGVIDNRVDVVDSRPS
jgi:hypothetical protein